MVSAANHQAPRPECVVIDFETRSRVDLSSTNSFVYGSDESTEVLCLAWSSVGSDDVRLWLPGEPFPFAENWPHYAFWTFNAEFELAIWNGTCVRYGWPELKPEQVFCLKAESSFFGLPRHLSGVCEWLELGEESKSADSRRLINTYCKPKSSHKQNGRFVGGTFLPTPPEMYDYCKQDVTAELAVRNRVPRLSKFERKLWLVHYDINRRGVPVDLKLCHNACVLFDMEKNRICEDLQKITDGFVSSPNQVQKIREFAAKHGVPLESLTKKSVDDVLLTDEVPENVKTVLELRGLSRDAAAAKYPAILRHASPDGRCRMAHVFYEAGTGRWSASGVNFLNLRRLPADASFLAAKADMLSKTSDVATVAHDLQPIIPTLGAMVRMAVCASPGNTLVVCDFASIEMRVLHWLAGDSATLRQISDFDCGRGEDPYKLAAAQIYGKPASAITKDERQSGKVLMLGCGYLSGAEKFLKFCNQYGIQLTAEESYRLVQLYRRSYPAVTRFWKVLGSAAVNAVKNRGRRYEAGRISFCATAGALAMRLPSGRVLHYLRPTLTQGAYGDEIEVFDVRANRRKALSLPMLVENADQATSRDLLAGALVKCSKHGLNVVLHVYDEIVVEAPESRADETCSLLRQLMQEPPSWAAGVPIAASAGHGRRYAK